MDNFLRHYLIAALWSSNDVDETPLDKNYGIEDVSEAAIEESKKDIAKFKELAGSILDDLDEDQVAHDVWLTRNRHGAGHWDRGYEKSISDKLTTISHQLGEKTMYVGDDGKIYIS